MKTWSIWPIVPGRLMASAALSKLRRVVCKLPAICNNSIESRRWWWPATRLPARPCSNCAIAGHSCRWWASSRPSSRLWRFPEPGMWALWRRAAQCKAPNSPGWCKTGAAPAGFMRRPATGWRWQLKTHLMVGPIPTVKLCTACASGIPTRCAALPSGRAQWRSLMAKQAMPQDWAESTCWCWAARTIHLQEMCCNKSWVMPCNCLSLVNRLPDKHGACCCSTACCRRQRRMHVRVN